MNCACKVSYDNLDTNLDMKYFCWKEIFSSLEKMSCIPLDTDADLDVQTLIGFQELLHMPGIWKGEVSIFKKHF